MMSPRYAAGVAALLALALVPTVIHSYRGATVPDGRAAADVPSVLAGSASAPTDRRPGWVRNNFDTADYIERTYQAGGAEVTLFVARSYDAKRLYHHPELALLRGGIETTPAGVARLPGRDDLPLHVVTMEKDGRRGVAVYALLYEDRFIDSPIAFQLRTSAALLLSGRKPLTIFMASAFAGSGDRLEEAPATKVLLAAVDAFLAPKAAGN